LYFNPTFEKYVRLDPPEILFAILDPMLGDIAYGGEVTQLGATAYGAEVLRGSNGYLRLGLT
jgi:hypothetical protein